MSASRTSSFMNETINSLRERWFNSSHVVLEIWLSSCHAPLSDKARDEISTLWPSTESVASLLAQTGKKGFQGRTVTQGKTSERYLVETKKTGCFPFWKPGECKLLKRLGKWRCQRCYIYPLPRGMRNAADEVSPTTQNTSSCQPESHPRRGKRERG